jgi:VanZ family protein
MPAIVWSAILIALSGRGGSSGVTAGILELLLPARSPLFEPLHFLIRKTIHVLAYGTLGALDFRAVRGARSGWTLRWSGIAMALVLAIASIDEWHQSFVPGRTGTPVDVAIDCLGAMLAQVGVRHWALARLRPALGPRP